MRRTLDYMNEKINLFDICVYLMVTLLVLFDHIWVLDQCPSKLVWISFILIFALAMRIWFLDDRFLSINKMIAIYVFLFWYYAPLHQYVAGKTYYSLPAPDDDIYLLGNALILVFCCCYVIAYRLFKLCKQKNTFRANEKISGQSKVLFSDLSSLFVIFINISSLIYLLAVDQLFRFWEDDASGITDSLGSIIVKIVRFVPVATLILTIYFKQRNEKPKTSWLFAIMQIVNIVVFGIVFFPLNGIAGRFYLFGVYFMIAACLFSRVKRKSWLMILVAVGFYLIFPAFNFFKYHTVQEFDQFRLGGFDTLSNDYDSHFMLLKTIEYTKSQGLSWGTNLLAGVLWFVPRSIWHSKANPSGEVVSSAYNAVFTNVSCPYGAEWYYAFGIAGVVIGAALLGCIAVVLEGATSDYGRGINSIAVGMILAFMRGAFLPVMSTWMSINLSFTTVYLVTQMLSSKISKRKGDYAIKYVCRAK